MRSGHHTKCCEATELRHGSRRDEDDRAAAADRKIDETLYNPASEIELPRVERRLPRYVLTANEADRVLSQPDITTPFGIRDRAMLEVLYSTGIRRAELVHLTIYDLDAERGTIMVRLGKGRKDRMVPIGESAIAWTEKYRAEVRPTLVSSRDDERHDVVQRELQRQCELHLKAGHAARPNLGRRDFSQRHGQARRIAS